MISLPELRATETSARAADFLHLARLILKSRGDANTAIAMAEAERGSDRLIKVLKAAVGAGTVAGFGGSIDANILSNAFVQSLHGISVFDTLYADANGQAQVPQSRCQDRRHSTDRLNHARR